MARAADSATTPLQCTLRQSLEGHKGGVLGLAFTKNGRYVLSASQDKSVRLWNPLNGVSVKTYSGPHNHEVNGVIVSEDNSKFVTCGGDKQFFQWDVTTGNVIRKFVGHDRKVNALAFGPSESVIISGSHDKTVRIWDLRARSRGSLQVLTDATDSVLCVNVGGDEISTGSTDGQYRRYDVRKGQLISDSMLQPIGSVCYSNDRECALVSTLDDNIRLIERDTGNELASYKGHTNKRFKVQSALDPSDSFVVSGSEDNTFCFWDLVDSKLLHSVRHHAGPVFCVSWHEGTLATASADGVIHVWDVLVEAPRTAQASARRGVNSLTMSLEKSSLPFEFGKKQPQKGRYPAPAAAGAELQFHRAEDGGGGGSSGAAAPSRDLDLEETEETETAAVGTAAPDTAGSEQAPAAPAAPAKKRGDRGKKGKRKDIAGEEAAPAKKRGDRGEEAKAPPT